MTKSGELRDNVSRLLTAEMVATKYNFRLPKTPNRPIRCPLGTHDDKTPSFSIDPDKNLWNCFSCDKKGDMFSLVAEMEHLDVKSDFPKVLDIAADMCGIVRDTTAQERRGDKEKPKFKIEWDAAETRDITAARSTYIARKKIDIQNIEVSLRAHNETDFIVPIRSHRGEMIGLQRGTKMAYSGSKASGFFMEQINKNETVYLVEGLSDYLTMHSCGITNVIGLFSVNVADDEVKAVLQNANDIKICLDYDSYDENGITKGSRAGFKKTKSILKTIPHAVAYFASMTEKKDLSDVFMELGKGAIIDIFSRPGFNYDDILRDEDSKSAPSTLPRYVAHAIAKERMIAVGDADCWKFKKGVWEMIDKAEIEELIMNEFIRRGMVNPKYKDITEARQFIRIATRERLCGIREALAQSSPSGDNTLFFADGKYDFIEDSFSPYSPSDYVFARLNTKFKMTEEKPTEFLKFLNQIFDGYENKEEYIQLMREWIGYAMYPKMPIHAFMYLYGTGGNGKGVLFSAIADILGHTNVINTNIKAIEANGERSIIQFFGKYANLGSEEKRGTSMDAPILKQLSSGDPVTGRRLYREALTFVSHAKMFFSGNHLPQGVEDASNMSRRINLIHLKHVFDDGLEKRGDTGLLQRILNEKHEITWWAIGGLKNLLERGYFDKPDSMRVEEKRLLSASDPVTAFLDRAAPRQLVADKKMSLDDLYGSFRDFLIDKEGRSHRYVPSKSTFREGLEKRGFTFKAGMYGEDAIAPEGKEFTLIQTQQSFDTQGWT